MLSLGVFFLCEEKLEPGSVSWGRGGEGAVEGREAVVRIYCMRKEPISIKKENYTIFMEHTHIHTLSLRHSEMPIKVAE